MGQTINCIQLLDFATIHSIEKHIDINLINPPMVALA